MTEPALSDLLVAFVADSAAQIALVGRIEPDRDQDCAVRRRRVHQLRILERSSVAAIGDRRESLGICCLFGGGVRLFQQRTSAWSSSPSSRRIR
jgi:hypothetical protein